jgi:hypothetical protein
MIRCTRKELPDEPGYWWAHHFPWTDPELFVVVQSKRGLVCCAADWLDRDDWPLVADWFTREQDGWRFARVEEPRKLCGLADEKSEWKSWE